MAEEPRKRSRFDQTEPEPPRKSRFDRRSRSPARNEAEPQRSRSPVTKSESPANSGGASKKTDAAAAAAAAAARINEQINAKKAAQKAANQSAASPLDIPPVRTTSSPLTSAGAAKSPTQSGASGTLPEEIYQQDGDYIKDIEVNDLRNRYTLTKGSTQKMIKEKTGADVTTRGNYYPDKSMATPANPPLYLHVTSTSKDGLEQAVAEINELMKQELPNLIDERRFRRREPDPVERDSLGRRKWPEEKIPIDLEPIPGFNLRAQVVGQGGSYVKHIQQATKCRVQIKGRGSGFMEHDTQRESDEQMYLHVAGPDPNEVAEAARLCHSLLENVRTEYESFKERGPPQRSGGGGGGGNHMNADRGNHYDDPRFHHRDRNGSGSYGGGGGGAPQYPAYGHQTAGSPNNVYGGGAQSPVSAQQQGQQQQAAAHDPQQIAAWIQYYAANPEQDPYHAYGGYAAIIGQYYSAQQQGYAGSPTQQQQQQQGMGMGVNGQQQQQPPPPGSEEVPPPPPPPGPGP